MAKTKLLTQMKAYIYAMIDSNGNRRVYPMGVLRNRDIDSKRLDVLYSFIRLLLETDIIKPETKMYIMDENITMARVYERIIEDPEFNGETSERAIINRISRDQEKITAIFGSSMLADLLYTSKPLEVYADLISREYSKRSELANRMRENLVLNLDKDVIYTELNDDEFKDLFETLRSYTKAQVLAVADSMDKRYVGYFNYLTSSPNLSKKDTARLNKLKRIILGEISLDAEVEDQETDDSTDNIDDYTEDTSNVLDGIEF